MNRDEWTAAWAVEAVHWSEDVTAVRADGYREIEATPSVWTMLHRGSSTKGHIHAYLHRTRDDALHAAALFALEALNAPEAGRLYRAGKYEELCAFYERTHFTGDGILRVEPSDVMGDRTDVDGTWRQELSRSPIL